MFNPLTMQWINFTINRINFTINRINITINRINFTINRINITINRINFTINRINITINRINFVSLVLQSPSDVPFIENAEVKLGPNTVDCDLLLSNLKKWKDNEGGRVDTELPQYDALVAFMRLIQEQQLISPSYKILPKKHAVPYRIPSHGAIYP